MAHTSDQHTQTHTQTNGHVYQCVFKKRGKEGLASYMSGSNHLSFFVVSMMIVRNSLRSLSWLPVMTRNENATCQDANGPAGSTSKLHIHMQTEFEVLSYVVYQTYMRQSHLMYVVLSSNCLLRQSKF